MTAERKFIDLKDLKVSDEGAGFIEGYRSIFSEIDEGGDLIVKGAFADCLDEYLHSGFTAQSHDWDFKEAVGFPVEAKEDEYGWFVRSQFHSTPDAQAIRTKARERLDAGKQVGFSFGYAPTEYVHVEAKDYEKDLPQYITPARLAVNLAKAQKFNRIRILKKLEAIEDSIVTAPMQKMAAATGVKSDTPPANDNADSPDNTEAKGMLAEEMAQTTPSIWEVESALHRVARKIAETAKDANVTGAVIDWRAKVADLVSEYGPQIQPIITAQIEEFLDSTDEEFYLKGITGTESFESFEAAGTELKKFAQKMRSCHEIRLKEGRVLSSSNRAKVQACKDSMTALIADLDDLLVLSEPKPKETDKENVIPITAPRTQTLRLKRQQWAFRLRA